jgi:serine/threonine-protein kinase
MYQNKYQPISTIKLSTKGEFQWVKCPSETDPERFCILQSYYDNLAGKILDSVQWEIDRLLPLSHPHLQSVSDIFASEDSLHIVQELGQWECAIHQAPYTPVRIKILLQEIIPALVYLHDRGITHGNITPETIVVNDHQQHILTNFLVINDLITVVGGDTYPRLRPQLERIPSLKIPTGQEWDLFSLGVTTIALLTNREYQELYDPDSRRWKWSNYVDCSEELTRSIDRLLGQEKQPLKLKLATAEAPIVLSEETTTTDRVAELGRTNNSRISTHFYQTIFGLLLLGLLGLVGYLIWEKFYPQSIVFNPINSKLDSFSQNGLTVGYINRPPSRDRSQSQIRDYPQFKSYLETELRKKYGNGLKVELESVMTTREAQNRIKQKKWDLAFAFSATNSLIAEDNKYEFIARMSANEDPYRDVCFFVKKDSKIESNKDFTPDRTIALPNEDSPIFIMPFYDLYGKKMRINLGNNLSKIQEKVKSGEADIGVNFCKTISQKPEFKTLSPNRIIPVGGVFLSPRIEKLAERDYIKQTIAKAPDDIQSKANYTTSSGVNYSQFRRINDRANQLLNCVDFTRNPVNFYCNNSTNK